MHSSFIHRVVVTLFVVLVTCLAGAAAAGGQELPRVTPPRAVSLEMRKAIAPQDDPTRPVIGQRGFVPAGAFLSARLEESTGSATLRGIVVDLRSEPCRSLPVQWWLDGATGGGQTTTGDDGTYLLSNVPDATANGAIAVSGTIYTDPLVDFSVAHTGLSWSAAGESTFDFTVVKSPVTIVEGGPWADWSRASINLYGLGAYGGSACETHVVRPATVPEGVLNTRFAAMPGRYDQGAVYWWANEGLELSTPIRVSPSSRRFSDVHFIDTSTGWLLASDPGARTSSSSVFRTADGGRSWAVWVGPSGVELTDLVFTDAAHGWAVGSKYYFEELVYREVATIFVTSDGGATWNEQTVPVTAPLDAVDFADSLHGTAVGDGGSVVTTDDGGVTWREGSSGVTSGLRDVSLADSVHGWACGDETVILTTTDGGSTWAPQGPEDLATWITWLTAIDCADGVHVAAGSTGYMSARLIYSADGGATWQEGVAGNRDAVTSIDLIDGSVGWAVTEHGGILKTTDGGATWSTQRYFDESAERGLNAVAAVDAEHAWAAGSGWLTDTLDGGTWAEPWFGASQITALRFAVRGRLGVSGNPGSAVRLTLDCPANWESAILGEPDFPASAVERELTTYTWRGVNGERKVVTLPKTAKPGYFYWFAVGHKTGPLYLYAPFQVSLLKASDTSIRTGESARLSGVIPTQGHWGSTPGKVKRVALYKSTTSATKGFKFVKYKRADGYGKFNLGTVSPTRSTWYIVLYPGDKTYWEDVTSPVKVTVR